MFNQILPQGQKFNMMNHSLWNMHEMSSFNIPCFKKQTKQMEDEFVSSKPSKIYVQNSILWFI